MENRWGITPAGKAFDYRFANQWLKNKKNRNFVLGIVTFKF